MDTQGRNDPAYGAAPNSESARSSAPSVPLPTAPDGKDIVEDYCMLSPDATQANDLREHNLVLSDEARTEKAGTR